MWAVPMVLVKNILPKLPGLILQGKDIATERDGISDAAATKHDSFLKIESAMVPQMAEKVPKLF